MRCSFKDFGNSFKKLLSIGFIICERVSPSLEHQPNEKLCLEKRTDC